MERCIYFLKSLAAYKNEYQSIKEIRDSQELSPTNQAPSLAEIKHAQNELAIALQYISLAKNVSTEQINQTFNKNIQQPLNQGLLKPLNHFKETS